MHYYIIGAGGTGGSIGGFLSAAGKDVTFVVREPHLSRLKEKGLILHSDLKGNLHQFPIHAIAAGEKNRNADVVFVCVKSYHLDDIIPIIKEVAKSNALVIPILNPFGASARLAKALPDCRVMEGRIYINAFKDPDGDIHQQGKVFKVVFGPVNGAIDPAMRLVASDLQTAGIHGKVTADIQKEAFRKFSYISPYAATGAFFRAKASEIQSDPKMREFFIALSKEVIALGNALEIPVDSDQLDHNILTLEHMHPEATASLQKDMEAGKESEIDGLIVEVIRLGAEKGLSLPNYKKVAMALGVPPDQAG